MGIGDWGLGIGDWGLGPIPISLWGSANWFSLRSHSHHRIRNGTREALIVMHSTHAIAHRVTVHGFNSSI